jgi:hypothetical protein
MTRQTVKVILEGEGNTSREIGFKRSNLFRNVVCNHDSKIVIYFEHQVLKFKGCLGQYHLLR